MDHYPTIYGFNRISVIFFACFAVLGLIAGYYFVTANSAAAAPFLSLAILPGALSLSTEMICRARSRAKKLVPAKIHR